jgi:hypothetical protein
MMNVALTEDTVGLPVPESPFQLIRLISGQSPRFF